MSFDYRLRRGPFDPPPAQQSDLDLSAYVGAAGIDLQGASGDNGAGGEVWLTASTAGGGDASLLGGNGSPAKTGGTARIQGGSGHGTAGAAAAGIFEGGQSDGSDGRIELIGAEIAFTLGTAPQVPASPTEQDIVDALITLGLVTQA